MNLVPESIGELLRGLPPASLPQSLRRTSVIASATELLEPNGVASPPFLVVLHSVTDGDLRFIHAQKLASNSLAVRIQLDTGEILRFVLTAAESERKGELFESTGVFI